MGVVKRLIIVRHAQSVRNAWKMQDRDRCVAYQAFLKAWNANPMSEEAKCRAQHIQNLRIIPEESVHVPLAPGAGKRAKTTAEKLKEMYPLPDAVYVSPYERTRATHASMQEGWQELANAHTIQDDIRVREYSYGIATGDLRIFFALHPEQKRHHDASGFYWYRFPQGEDVPAVRLRAYSWMDDMNRRYDNGTILLITHSLFIIPLRANLERFGEIEYMRILDHDFPINCGVTVYEEHNGKLKLTCYNKKYY